MAKIIPKPSAKDIQMQNLLAEIWAFQMWLESWLKGKNGTRKKSNRKTEGGV